MTQPTIIIEIRGGKLDALYSNADVLFYLIDRDDETASAPITGPFNPTVEKADLSGLFFNEPEIPERLTETGTPVPYF